MKAHPECIVCIFRQALNTARIAGRNPGMHTAILAKLASRMQKPDMRQTPAGLSRVVYRTVKDISGRRDPYARIKRETNRAAMALLPELLRIIRKSRDPLKTACKLAVAGNIIDLGIGHGFDLARDVRAILNREFSIDAYDEFKRELKPGRRLLYIGDNSGEIVFDRVLIEYLLAAGIRATFVVKSAPIINDATMADARMTGMTGVVPVIATGSDDIGIYWPRVSAEFKRAFRAADFIIAKGHGNFETCVGHRGNFYFLLKAKCEIVAAELEVKLGDIVFAHHFPK